jgi:hypothetical protein
VQYGPARLAPGRLAPYGRAWELEASYTMTHLHRCVSMLFALALPVAVATAASAQEQSKEQQKCINKLNKDGAKVAQAQSKENLACVKNAGKNKLTGTAQDCLTDDAKQKVMKKRNTTVADQGKFCTDVPDFGYSGALATNDAAAQGEIDLVADLFGTPLDAAVIDCATDKSGCVCQQKTLKNAEKLAATKIKEFLKCKKQALKGGATSSAALADCVANAGTVGSIAADTKEKIAKKQAKLEDDILAKCAGTSAAFPGVCGLQVGTALATCVDQRVECRVCQIINEMDGLSVNCDLFDDGDDGDQSCASGDGPPATPTATPVPGVEFQGALLASTGRFTYQATIGISGADAECAAQFPGTHACTYAELQIAEAAGDLVGAEDTGGSNVTSFWAIDPLRPDDDQCTVTVPWDYATAHTGQFGDAVTLDNGTGTLGSLATGTVCAFSRWVGCCL